MLIPLGLSSTVFVPKLLLIRYLQSKQGWQHPQLSSAKNSLKSLKIKKPLVLIPTSNHQKWLSYQILGGKIVKKIKMDPQTTEIYMIDNAKRDMSEWVCKIYLIIEKLYKTVQILNIDVIDLYETYNTEITRTKYRLMLRSIIGL